MAQAKIERKFPGKTAEEIYEKLDHVVERLAAKMGFTCHKDAAAKLIHVSKMGIKGDCRAHEEKVAVDLHFPMLIPSSLRAQVVETIEKKLDGLFAV